MLAIRNQNRQPVLPDAGFTGMLLCQRAVTCERIAVQSIFDRKPRARVMAGKIRGKISYQPVVFSHCSIGIAILQQRRCAVVEQFRISKSGLFNGIVSQNCRIGIGICIMRDTKIQMSHRILRRNGCGLLHGFDGQFGHSSRAVSIAETYQRQR